MSASTEYPLHAAAREGRFSDLENLLSSTDQTLDVNKGTYDLMRPLHEACLGGHYECAFLLHKFGAEVNLRNIDGGTPLSDACAKGSVECAKFLLENGAKVNPPFLLITPLHEAILGNNWQLLPLLIHYGADLEASDLDFGTPLQVAIKKGFIECASILLQSGANVNTCKSHQTPLHSAAYQQDASLIELLLIYGADVHKQNCRGLTARQLVSDHNVSCRWLLESCETTPKSLRHTCRLCIRRAVGPERITSIVCLQLPRILTKYLEYG